MKSYSHIIEKIWNSPTVITPSRMAAICHIIEARLAASSTLVEMPSQRARVDDGEMSDEGEEMRQFGQTAIIPVHGTIVQYPEDLAMSECGCCLDELNAKIDMAENDSSITRVIYDFRTPGGSVTGVPETGRKILHSRKETIAFTNSECCSGGIWLAAQCQRFYATQSSRVGSVGVYTMSLDMSGAMKKEGVKVNAISAGKFKLLGAYWKPLTDEEKAIKQAGVDKIYAQFKEAMESYRLVTDEHFGNGLVFDGEEAAALGFTDGVVEDLGEVVEGMV